MLRWNSNHSGRLPKVGHWVIVALLVALLAACNGENPEDESDESAADATPVTVQLYLGAPQIEYAGIYGAISQGYFEDENLKVELNFQISADSSSATEISGLEAVESGGPVFAEGSAEGLLELRQDGHTVAAVLTLYQRDSRSIVALRDKQIDDPSDLRGKRLLVVPGTESITKVFLKAVGLSETDVTLVYAEEGGVDWLVEQIVGGAVDALVFSIESAVQLEAAGFDTVRIAFFDYGIQSYANVLYTSTQLIDERPEIVQRFVNAVARGMAYAIERPEALAAWFVEHYQAELHPLQVNVQDEAMVAIIPLMQTSTTKPGEMSIDTWTYLANSLMEMGLLDASIKPEDVYALQFLEAYYQ